MGLAGSLFQQISIGSGAEVADTVFATTVLVNARRLVDPLSVDTHRYKTPAVEVARGIAQILVTLFPSPPAVSNATELVGVSSSRLPAAAVVTQ